MGLFCFELGKGIEGAKNQLNSDESVFVDSFY